MAKKKCLTEDEVLELIKQHSCDCKCGEKSKPQELKVQKPKKKPLVWSWFFEY